MSTILEKIQKNEANCLDNPSLLSEYLVILCANIIEAENRKTMADINYAKKWQELRPTVESDKQCDMKCKIEEVYVHLKATEALSKTILETIRACKKRLAFLSVEYNELTFK